MTGWLIFILVVLACATLYWSWRWWGDQDRDFRDVEHRNNALKVMERWRRQ